MDAKALAAFGEVFEGELVPPGTAALAGGIGCGPTG